MKDIQYLIAEMTREEKASLCSGLNFWRLKGVERLDIPSIMVTDGPHGLRKQITKGEQLGINDSVPATCFPTAAALAATWDRDLIFKVGQALGEECRQEKVGVILGPGANIKRSPLCGRNFEYFSEDPFLSGEIAKSHIKGVQSQGIGTSLKHFAANNQESGRMTIDAIIDERALREIYLAGFEIAVKGAQPWTLMGAYNRVNGTYACENPHLLGILKDEWKHEGLVMTDWGAMNERVDALKAGLEIEMPGVKNGNDQKIVEAVQNGELDETVLDRAAERILALIFKAEETISEEFTYDQQAHHALARQVASEGAVLLKNDDNILPLNKNLKIALIGAFSKTPRYQGAGSSLINPSQLDNLYDEMVKIVGEENITYAPGYPIYGDYINEELLQDALLAAQNADVVIIHAGLPDLFEVEGLDRQHLRLPNSHNLLIETISERHPNVVLVLSNGSPIVMPWLDKVKAILEGYLGGQAGAGGVADVLFGIVNPGGKLAETFPLKLEDTPSYQNFPGGPRTVEYRESIYVGYRFYETVGKDVLFPFGYGLSYTTFEYSGLELSQQQFNDQETLTVKFRVKNTGGRAGKEIAQLYISPASPTAFRPKLELKGFEKVSLQPGEEKEVIIQLDRRSCAYFNTELEDWHVESGTYQVLVGASSQDIRLRGEVQVTSSQPDAPINKRDRLDTYVNFPPDAAIKDEDFKALMGRSLPLRYYQEGQPYTINTPISEMQDSFFGRQLQKIMAREIAETIKDNPNSPNALMIKTMLQEAPLRIFLMHGGIDRELLDALLDLMNGKFFKGLGGLIKNWLNK